ncbi:MAG TPA: alpha-galactosidase [Puia sp.]|nr:alpha-galactosidase [Puia sp.]
MKKSYVLMLALLLPSASFVAAQSFASWTKSELKLNNGIIERTIKLPGDKGNFGTILYKPVQGDFKYFTAASTDFQLEINDRVYSGNSSWLLKNVVKYTDSKSGDGAAVIIESEDKKIELTVRFLLYPGLPVIRKNLLVKNLSPETVKLESLDIEKFDVTAYWATTFSWVCHDYGRRCSIGPYEGNMQDALVIVHNSDWKQGIVIGNEAPGVIKQTSVFWRDRSISSGLTHKDARFPFRKYIKPGETFETPQIFIMLYNNHKSPGEILNTAVPEFIRNHLGTRLSELKQKPTFVYNTWEPFETNINEKLVMELAKSASDAGMKEFIIDDGWEENYGDWVIDKKKFPNGLKPVFAYIKSLGMKPGLWISIGSAASTSKVFEAHPEWFVRDRNGHFTSLQAAGDKDRLTACFSTGWYEYIKKILLNLSIDYGLEYMKLDFAVVTSPYTFNNTESGCYATNHPGHIDHNESLYTNYEQVWKLFDELHSAKPGLFIDCTFEATGGLQLIDYAMLKHAEGNWLSNFNGPGEKVDLRIRNMAWWRSPAIPATALVIGNPEMQDTAWDLHIKSLAGALPIMLGDPRKLSSTDLIKYKGFADWLQLMDNRYQIMSYRQDLPGFGEPTEAMWDGFQRINAETKTGGIIGVFRHGAVETKRQVTIRDLDPLKTYEVRQMDGKIINTQTGKELIEKGFEVLINKLYDGDLFEIRILGLPI